MKFHLPGSVRRTTSTTPTTLSEHIFFVEEAAAAWSECLMSAAESTLKATPLKQQFTSRATTPEGSPTTSEEEEELLNATTTPATALSIDLSGASLPDSTVEFLCDTVLPHYFELAFSAGTAAAVDNISPAVFPGISIRLQFCSLSPTAAVAVVEALVSCAEVFSNTFAPLLQPGGAGADGEVSDGPLIPVALDLGFNYDINDAAATEIVGIVASSTGGRADDNGELLLDVTGQPLSSVGLQLDLGLSGSSLSSAGLLKLIRCGVDTESASSPHRPPLLLGGRVVSLSGISAAQTEVTFSSATAPAYFCEAVCDTLLIHPSLQCLTLGDDAFMPQETLPLEKLQLAAKSNVIHGSCRVVVVDEAGVVVSDDSNGGETLTSSSLATTKKTVKKVAVTTCFTPQRIIIPPRRDTEASRQQLADENAALKAQLEAALKSCRRKKKKKVVSKKGVSTPATTATAAATNVVVAPLGISAAVFSGLYTNAKHTSTATCDKENSAANIHTKAKHLPSSATPRIGTATPRIGAATPRLSCQQQRSSSSATTGGRLSRSNSTTSSVSNSGAVSMNGGCNDCVKWRRALHTHGANRMPTTTLKSTVRIDEKPSWQH